MTKDMENAEIFNSFFSSLFTNKTSVLFRLLLSLDEAKPGVLSIRDSLAQERHGYIGETAAKCHKGN